MTLQSNLLTTLKHLLFRHPVVPSDTRWTLTRAALGYASLWMMICNLAHQAVSLSFRMDKEELAATSLYQVDDGTDWNTLFGVRLKRTFCFLQDAWTRTQCAVGVLTNTPVLRMMHFVLKHDAKREPSVSGWAKRQGGRGGPQDIAADGRPDAPDSPDADDGDPTASDPVGFHLVRCYKVSLCLQHGADLIRKDDDPRLPDYAAAVRSHLLDADCEAPSATAKSDLINLVWQSLLPGMGQLWFRCFFMWFYAWPFRLGLLVVTDDPVLHLRVVRELLDACFCCLDTGFGAVLRDAAIARWPNDRNLQEIMS